jgi:PhnB protein
MEMTIEVNFKGECEAAFRFYVQCLGAELGSVFRYAGSPFANRVPENWSDKIMHGSVTIGGQVLMGADVTEDQFVERQGFSLSLQIKDTADAERIFDELARGGVVRVPLEETFWAARFGMVVDRFGVPWQVNCEE